MCKKIYLLNKTPVFMYKTTEFLYKRYMPARFYRVLSLHLLKSTDLTVQRYG